MWQYPFDPTAKQRDALVADVDEVLYGGALGGGKSEVLLAACMTLCTMVPGSKALLLRRSFPELNELVQRLRERVPRQAAEYNKSDHIFNFANGSQLVLGYLDGPDDHERYQGAEYQLICFDELTHYLRKSYVLLLTRLRCTGEVARLMNHYGFKMRALSASNPGSRGHAWVKERFIEPAAKHTVFTGSDGTRRVFIPARLYDNPHIDHEEYLRKLGPLDPEMTRALVEGDWDIVSGVRFSQWRENLHVIDPEELPIPTLTGKRCVAVDYGFSAPFAALWMAKLADGLIVIYRELYRTELTARQQAELIRDSESDWETAAGPHRSVVMDPSMWRRNDATAGKPVDKDAPPVGSPAHDYQDVLGQTPIKAANARVHGWSRLDEKLRIAGDGLPRILVYSTCRDLIRTLPSIPRSSRDPEDVDTDAEDHLCFVAGTMVASEGGQRPIQDIRPGDRVWTRAGLRTVTQAGVSDSNAIVGTVQFSDGKTLIGTPNHPVFTRNRGVVRMDALRYCDTIFTWHHTIFPLPIRALSTDVTPTPRTLQTPGITRHPGMIIMAGVRYLPASMSTTTTTTRTITTHPTSSSSKGERTPSITWLTRHEEKHHVRTLPRLLRQLMHGIAARKAASGTPITPKSNGPNGAGIRGWMTSPKTAETAGRLSRPTSTPKSNGPNGAGIRGWMTSPKTAETAGRLSRPTSTPKSNGPNGAGIRGWMTSPKTAETAGRLSRPTSTKRPAHAPVSVRQRFEPIGADAVYNLTVEGVPEYYANGVLVHNCDALRYGLMHLEGKSIKPSNPSRGGTPMITAGLGSKGF